MVTAESHETYRFQGFELNVAAYELRRDGQPVRLERQPMDLLILLVERRRQLVSRSDIVARLAAGKVVENVCAGLRRKDGTTQEVLLNSNTLLGDARTPGAGVLVAALPIASSTAAPDGRVAISSLVERRRKEAAARARRAASGEPS